MHPIAIHTTVSKKSKHHSKWSATATYIMSPDHPRAPSTATIALHLNPIKKETSSINPQPSFSKTKVTDFISINSRKLPSPRPLPINARTSHRVFKREWKWRHSRIRTSLSGATIHTHSPARDVLHMCDPVPAACIIAIPRQSRFHLEASPQLAEWVSKWMRSGAGGGGFFFFVIIERAWDIDVYTYMIYGKNVYFIIMATFKPWRRRSLG